MSQQGVDRTLPTDSSLLDQLFRSVDSTGNTIFHELAYAGSLSMLSRFYERTGDVCSLFINDINTNGEYAIHVAASNHREFRAIDVLKRLVELEADINATDQRYGLTVLHIAVQNDDYALAIWLCGQTNINIHTKNGDNLTAFQIASAKNNQLMMHILKSYGAIDEDLKEFCKIESING